MGRFNWRRSRSKWRSSCSGSSEGWMVDDEIKDSEAKFMWGKEATNWMALKKSMKITTVVYRLAEADDDVGGGIVVADEVMASVRMLLMVPAVGWVAYGSFGGRVCRCRGRSQYP